MLFTGLNFLFFWLTWTTLVLSHSPLRVELFGTFVIRLVFYLAPSIFFFLFDTILPYAASSIKAQGHIALPSGDKRRKISRKEVKIIGWSLFNIFFSIAVQAAAEFTLTKVLRRRSLIKVAVRLPYPWGITTDIVRGFILREVGLITLKSCLYCITDDYLLDHELYHSSLRPSQPEARYHATP